MGQQQISQAREAVLKDILSVLAGIIFLVGFVPYIRAILRKKDPIKPSKVSWLIWTANDAMILSGMVAKHSLSGQIVGALLGSIVTLVLALKFGKAEWTWVDKGSLAGSILGVILWALLKEPNFCIVISVGVALVGSIPTYVSMWNSPEDEDKVGWTIFSSSSIFAIGAIPALTWEDATQPIGYALGNVVIMFLLFIRPRLLLAKKPVKSQA